MEHIVRESIYPPAASPIPRLRLSPFLLIVVMMLAGFAVVSISAKVVAQYTPAPQNPFPAYADIFPGQAMSALEARGFSCQYFYDFYHRPTEDSPPTEASCFFTPAAGIFLSVKANISAGTLCTLIFTLRDNTLQVGDLEMLLKMPKLHMMHGSAYFTLPGSFVIARTANYAGEFSLFLPIWSITFTKHPL